MDFTPNLSLAKPAYPETADIAILNSNADILDQKVPITFVTLLNQNTAPFPGQLVFETNTSRLFFHYAGKYLLIATGDYDSVNPNRILIPTGSDLNPANKDSGYFQVGNNGVTHIAMDNNEIMCRNDASPAPLYLQTDGGTVYIGRSNPDDPANLVIESMSPKRDYVGSQQLITASSWASRGDCGATFKCPASKRIMISFSCAFNCIDERCYAAVRVFSGSSETGTAIFDSYTTTAPCFVAAENIPYISLGNMFIMDATQASPDMVVGNSYHAVLFSTKTSASGTNPYIDNQRISVVPLW